MPGTLKPQCIVVTAIAAPAFQTAINAALLPLPINQIINVVFNTTQQGAVVNYQCIIFYSPAL